MVSTSRHLVCKIVILAAHLLITKHRAPPREVVPVWSTNQVLKYFLRCWFHQIPLLRILRNREGLFSWPVFTKWTWCNVLIKPTCGISRLGHYSNRILVELLLMVQKSGEPVDVEVGGSHYLHPRKLIQYVPQKNPKMDYFNREFIFQPLIFRKHLTFVRFSQAMFEYKGFKKCPSQVCGDLARPPDFERPLPSIGFSGLLRHLDSMSSTFTPSPGSWASEKGRETPAKSDGLLGSSLVGGWTNPFEQYFIVKFHHFPRDRGEHKKCWNCHHLDQLELARAEKKQKKNRQAFFQYTSKIRRNQQMSLILPVVPHKAVAEVSKIGNV